MRILWAGFLFFFQVLGKPSLKNCILFNVHYNTMQHSTKKFTN